MKKVTASDMHKTPERVIRTDMEWGDYRSAVGRSTVGADCPFCKGYVTAYLWSLSGGGKRCPHCQAYLTRLWAIQWTELIDADRLSILIALQNKGAS